MYFGHGGLEPEVSQFLRRRRGGGLGDWKGGVIRCDQHGRWYEDGEQRKPSNMSVGRGRGRERGGSILGRWKGS